MIVLKEKFFKFCYEKIGMMKREKIMGLMRQKMMINDKVFKGKKKLIKIVFNVDLVFGLQKFSVNMILMGSLMGDLLLMFKIV